MSKSLTESAAEILSQTLGKAKDPMQKGPGDAEELGGQTPTTEPTAIGVTAAGKQKEAPKPGKEGATSEPMKKLAEDEVESTEEVIEEEQELTEEEVEQFLESLTDEEREQFFAELESEEAQEVVAEQEEVEQLPELTEEEIIEARKAKMKGMVDSSMGSCKEDVDALFNGESLSEEFRTKATTIFEAAVRARVETIVHQIAEENEKEVASEIEAIQAQLSEQVDEYLNYVVEQWMKENQVAIETGLRAEIAEDFINGLKNLFVEHYIEVPEEKADLVEEMAGRVVEAEGLLEEALGQMEQLEKQLNESKSVEILRRTCEGLTEMQVQKIKSLAEGVEFTTEGEYTEKLAVIRESYFPTKAARSEAPVTAVETVDDQEVSGAMDYYVKAITKTLPK
jgi:hypothetical protein